MRHDPRGSPPGEHLRLRGQSADAYGKTPMNAGPSTGLFRIQRREAVPVQRFVGQLLPEARRNHTGRSPARDTLFRGT